MISSVQEACSLTGEQNVNRGKLTQGWISPKHVVLNQESELEDYFCCVLA